MPGYNFFNYGQAAQQAEQIKGARQVNTLRGMQIKDQQDIIANRAKANKIRADFAKIPDQIKELESAQLFDQADKLRDYYINQQFNSIKLLSSLRDSIDETNYKQFRQDLIQSGAVEGKFMPTEYSDAWFKQQIKDSKHQLQVHTRHWATNGVTYSQDFLSQDGNIVEEYKPYEASADMKARTGGEGGPFKMKAADTNTIRNAAAALYGSMWDPASGSYIGLNKDQAKNVAAITEEASRIYNNNEGRLPHSMAVARAARKLNIQIPSLDANGDPLGLFQQ